jgi:hypothetical protein
MKITVEINDFNTKTLYDALLKVQFAGCKTYETLAERVLNDTIFRLPDVIKKSCQGLILMGYTQDQIIGMFPLLEGQVIPIFEKAVASMPKKSENIPQEKVEEWRESQRQRKAITKEGEETEIEPPKTEEKRTANEIKRKLTPKEDLERRRKEQEKKDEG